MIATANNAPLDLEFATDDELSDAAIAALAALLLELDEQEAVQS
jgi:hypothetical protein